MSTQLGALILQTPQETFVEIDIWGLRGYLGVAEYFGPRVSQCWRLNPSDDLSIFIQIPGMTQEETKKNLSPWGKPPGLYSLGMEHSKYK